MTVAAFAAATIPLIGAADTGSTASVQAVPPQADLLLVVDCLLPGQVRSLGQRTVYLSARRPARIPAEDCRIRGGEYVAYDRATMQSALAVWLPAAKEGDLEAAVTVGEIFERGIGGGTPDFAAAMHWYRSAADRGSMRAQINLGHMYEMGLGVPRDPAAAAGWYRKAAGVEVDLDAATISAPTSGQDSELRDTVRRLDEQAARRQEAERLAREAQAEAASLRDALQSEREALARARRDAPGGADDLAEQRRRAAEAESRLAQLTAQFGERERAFNLREQEAVAALAEQSALREQTERQLAAAKQETDRLRDLLQQERASIERKLDELSAAGSSLAEQQKEAADGAARIASLQRQLETSEATAAQRKAEVEARARADLARRESDEQSMAQARAEAAASQQALEDARIALEQSKAALQAAERSGAENARAAAASEARVALLAQQLTATEAASIQRQKEADALRAEVEQLRTSLAATEARLQQAEAQAANAAAKPALAPDALAAAGNVAAPTLAIIDPDLLASRGVVLVGAAGGASRQVVGRVQAPAGLLALNINDEAVTANELGVFTRNIALRGDETPVRVVAVDRQGKRAELSFTLRGKVDAGTRAAADAPTATGEDLKGLRFGNYHALVIGNNAYRHLQPLKSAVSDAQDVAQVLEKRYGFQVTLLLDADRYAVLSALNSLREKLTSEDNLLVYYAGHGELDAVNSRGHWLPIDAERNSTANWIPTTAVTDILNVMQARQIMLIVDSCYSGALTRSSMGRLSTGLTPEERRHWVRSMLEKRSRTVLTSGGLEPVLDSGGGRNSVFATSLLRVLREAQGIMDGETLHREISARVAYAAADLGFRQVPEYAPIRYAGHEFGEFFLLPRGGS